MNFYICTMYNLGRAPWNLSCFEFKFDDTRLSSWYKNKIGPIEIFVCYVMTLLQIWPIGCLSFEKLNGDSQQGRDLATSGGNKIKFQLGQSYSYVMRKLWYISLNLNSKQLRFHSVRHNVTYIPNLVHRYIRKSFS